jgi:hypothetical protein
VDEASFELEEDVVDFELEYVEEICLTTGEKLLEETIPELLLVLDVDDDTTADEDTETAAPEKMSFCAPLGHPQASLYPGET